MLHLADPLSERLRGVTVHDGHGLLQHRRPAGIAERDRVENAVEQRTARTVHRGLAGDRANAVSGPLQQRRVIGESSRVHERAGVRLAQRRAGERLRALGQPELLPGEGGLHVAIPDPLHGVQQWEHGDRAVRVGEGLHHGREQLRRGEGPGRVVTHHHRPILRHRAQRQPHGLLPGSAAGHHPRARREGRRGRAAGRR